MIDGISASHALPYFTLLHCMQWMMRWCGYLTAAKCKYIWSSWCHCHPIISCFIKLKSRMVYLSGTVLPRLSWKRGREIAVCLSIMCSASTVCIVYYGNDVCLA